MYLISHPHPSVHEDPLAEFLGISYQNPQAFELSSKQLMNRSFPRKELMETLKDYNKSIGNDEEALKQIDRLKSSETFCVVTGQQLGLMGGPSYTVLKGISCLLTAKATGSIPIFWLATEDHDVAEIDHTYLLDSMGNLQCFRLSFPKDGRSVEDLTLSSKNLEIIQNFFKFLKLTTPIQLEHDYSYAAMMAKIMAKLFAGTGMVFLEPKLLRPFAVPFFQKEIEENEKIQEILKGTTNRLEALGGRRILPLGEGSNLFLKQSPGKYRRKLRSEGEGFTAGSNQYSRKELLSLMINQPEDFSTNAAARTVLQSLLIPTLAYIAGPTEMAYYRQLGDYHHFHGISMPCLIPRLSTTLIPPFAATLLEKCGLNPWDKIPHHWPDLMPSIQVGEESLEGEWLNSAIVNFGKEIHSDMLGQYVKQSVRKLMHKICKRRLKQKNIQGYGLHLLRNLMHPHEKAQERVLNWWGFQAQSSKNLVKESLTLFSWKPKELQYFYFS